MPSLRVPINYNPDLFEIPLTQYSALHYFQFSRSNSVGKLNCSVFERSRYAEVSHVPFAIVFIDLNYLVQHHLGAS